MRFIITSLISLFFISCGGPNDSELIVGKWFNENHWFEFHNEKDYSGGVGPVISQAKQSYVLEPKEHKLTFYTDNASETYYVHYELIGNDTLAIKNFMNETSSPVKYYRSND